MEAVNKINNYIPVENIEQIKIINNSAFDVCGKDIEKLNENELLYCGKMYDILKEEFSHDTTIFYCINDEKEDILNIAFAEYLNENNEDNDDKSFSVVSNFIKMLITIGIQPENLEYFYYKTHKEILNLYTSTIQKICIDIPYPPPKLVS